MKSLTSFFRSLGVAFLNERHYLAAAECFRLKLESDPDDVETRELLMNAVTSGSKTYLSNEEITQGRTMEDMTGVRGGLAI